MNMPSQQAAAQFEDASEDIVDAVDTKTSRKSDSAFRTISEVADELSVQQHVLRFWETKFSQVRPLKRGGGRRYYRPEDVTLLKKIHELLYTQGYTIKGVQKLLREVGKSQLLQDAKPQAAPRQANNESSVMPVAAKAPSVPQLDHLSPRQRSLLESTLGELKELRSMVQ